MNKPTILTSRNRIVTGALAILFTVQLPVHISLLIMLPVIIISDKLK